MQQSKIFKKQSDPDIKHINDMNNVITNMYRDVCNKMAIHDETTNQFKQKQEQYFLKTFSIIMERMSNELKIAQDKYRNIDLEIQRDERVAYLNKELYFFRQQCLALKSEIKKLKTQNSRLLGLTDQLRDSKAEQYLLLIKRTKEKKALVTKIINDSSEQKQVTLLGQSGPPNKERQFETLTGTSHTMNNLRSKNNRSVTNQYSTHPFSEIDTIIGTDSRQKKRNKKNELLQIWTACVKEAKNGNDSMKFFSKQTKLKTLKNFFSTDKVYELLTCKIFANNCCNNANCIGNVNDPILNLDTDKPQARTLTVRPSTGRTKKRPQTSRPEANRPEYTPYRRVRQNQPLTIQTNLSVSMDRERS